MRIRDIKVGVRVRLTNHGNRQFPLSRKRGTNTGTIVSIKWKQIRVLRDGIKYSETWSQRLWTKEEPEKPNNLPDQCDPILVKAHKELIKDFTMDTVERFI